MRAGYVPAGINSRFFLLLFPLLFLNPFLSFSFLLTCGNLGGMYLLKHKSLGALEIFIFASLEQ